MAFLNRPIRKYNVASVRGDKEKRTPTQETFYHLI